MLQSNLCSFIVIKSAYYSSLPSYRYLYRKLIITAFNRHAVNGSFNGKQLYNLTVINGFDYQTVISTFLIKQLSIGNTIEVLVVEIATHPSVALSGNHFW